MALDSVVFVPLKPAVVGHVVANSIIEFLVILVVSARFASRIYLGSGLGTDDWLILVATILSIGLLTVVGLLSAAGSAYPVAEVMFNLQVVLKLTFATIPIYISTLLFTKLSMLFFYRRIFENAHMLYWVNGVAVYSVVWGIAHFLANVFVCTPVSAQFDLTVAATGTCGNQIALFQSLIITNILGDIMIMVLPMRTIWHLNMRKTEKLGLVTSFLLLGSVVVVGAVRVHYVSTTDMRGDVTGTMAIPLFLTCVEPNFGILCVSIPMLRPIYTRYRAKYATQLSGGDKYASNSAGGVRLHSFDRPSRKPTKNNTDPGVDTLIDQLDRRDFKYNAQARADDAPSIESEESEATRRQPPEQQPEQQPRGVIGIQTRWEVEVSQQ